MAQTQTLNLPVSDGTSMGAFIARPDGNSAQPGILVFQEAFGVNAHIRDICTRLAGEGFIALAPELYHRSAPGFEGRYDDFNAIMPHMKALTEAGLEADINAAYKALAAEPRLERGHIVSIGFCMGGRMSFLADALLPLRASVSFYGGGIAPNPMGPGLLDRTKDLHAPILLFWGGLDKHITPDQRQAVVEALREAKKPYVNVEFSEADHGFNCDARASYHPVSAKHAWGLTLAFLRTHLEG